MNNDPIKIEFISSVTFFAVALSALLLFYGQIDSMEQISEQKLTQWRVESDRRDEIKSLESLIKKVESEKALLETHFAYSQNPVPFLDSIEKLAKSVNAKITISSVDIAKDENALFVSMNTSGTFEALYRFITLMENSSYDLEFVSINIKKEGEVNTATAKQQTTDWSASMRIKLLTFIK
mgnify:CR=1 FL=1